MERNHVACDQKMIQTRLETSAIHENVKPNLERNHVAYATKMIRTGSKLERFMK